MKRFVHVVAAALGAAVVCALSLVAAPAAAAPHLERGAGVAVGPTPGGNADGTWLGQYVVRGTKVFCVDYALRAPDADQPYEAGDVLRTKWGGKIPAARASDISYLLLRYGRTGDDATAAAVAHLLHAWTSPVVKGHPGDPDDPAFDGMSASEIRRNLAYDSDYYLGKMSPKLQDRVAALRDEAAANRAPWRLRLTPPEHPQVNKAGTWTARVRSAGDHPVSGVDVTLTGTDATIRGNDSATVTTDDEGTARVDVTPTGRAPSVAAGMMSPNALPRVRVPLDDPAVQKVVLGGGEQNLTTKVRIRPGTLRVTKTDADSHDGIAGVSLRITGDDGKAPARTFTGKPLLGADKRPAVVQTGRDGTVEVPDLAAPQDVCVTETAPAKGYDQAFDPQHPPRACGSVTAGKTLTLSLSNKPNKVVVPVHIPAGGSAATVTASSATLTRPSPYALLGLGAVLLALVGAGGGLAARRARGR